MKKIIAIALMLGLCGGAAIYLSSCAQLGGPLSPDLTLLTANSTTKNTDKVGCTITAPSSLSGTAKVAFNLPMDSSSFTAGSTGSIRVYTLADAGTSETIYSSYSVSYNAHSQILTITPSNGIWTNDRQYHIEVTTAVRTLTGNQLDGNGNGIAENGAFDNVHATFTVGAPAAPSYIYHNIAIEASVSFEAGWFSTSPVAQGTLTFGSETGNIPANYQPITVTVTFSPYLEGSPATVGPNFGMDSSTFYNNASQLDNNIVLTDGNGNPVTVSNIEVMTTGTYANDQLRFVINATAGGAVYRLKIRGGLSGVRASSDSSLRLGRGFYFDGDSDNHAEASDDTQQAIFSTATVDNTPMPRFYVLDSNSSSCDENGELPRRIEIDFSIPMYVGSGTINPATVNNNTITLIDYYANQPITPISFETDNSTPGTPKVYVYIPIQFYDDTSGGTRTVHVKVKGVKTAEGLAMDQDNDGVVGQANDYYLSGDLSVYNHAY